MQLWIILKAQRRLFLSVLCEVVAIVLLISLIMPPTYLAQASLVIDTKATDPVSGNNIPGQLTATIIATQTDVIESHNVALKVVDRLKLTQNPGYIEKFKSATDGKGSLRDWIADKLSAAVLVRPSSGSNVINIEFPARDPVVAAQFTNAYADAYIDTSLELQADPAKRQSQWYDEETEKLRQRVEEAQTRFATEQRKMNLLGSTDRATVTNHIDVGNAKLAEISTELVTAQQALYDARTRLQQMNHAVATGQIEGLPDVLQNPLLQTLKTDLARAESTFADVAARYDRNHPQYIAAQATVRSLQSKIAAEVGSIRDGIEQTAQMRQHDVDQLQQALDTQKGTLLDEQRKHDALFVLNSEVDSAQKAYDAGLQRASQIRLASQLDQSTAAILNHAVPPFEPARPRVLLYTLISVFFGAILAAGICVVVEIADRRIRTRENIIEGTGLLVLAEIPRLNFGPANPVRPRLT
jgi:chain length determinant protein EpsF